MPPLYPEGRILAKSAGAPTPAGPQGCPYPEGPNLTPPLVGGGFWVLAGLGQRVSATQVGPLPLGHGQVNPTCQLLGKKGAKGIQKLYAAAVPD
jgi:hypothetical protein